jgi:hypothetical protein
MRHFSTTALSLRAAFQMQPLPTQVHPSGDGDQHKLK